MANKTEKEQTPKAEKAQNQAPKARVFPLEKLRANCQELFGVTDCTFVGATHGMTGEHTVEEIKAHIDKWRGTEVK
ncbi:MAG: hypothetical protein NC489_17680 [Ruminococcus flavefaciens]|nr:hypothetical protein [Ruminococcus flavefaciens]